METSQATKAKYKYNIKNISTTKDSHSKSNFMFVISNTFAVTLDCTQNSDDNLLTTFDKKICKNKNKCRKCNQYILV